MKKLTLLVTLSVMMAFISRNAFSQGMTLTNNTSCDFSYVIEEFTTSWQICSQGTVQALGSGFNVVACGGPNTLWEDYNYSGKL